MNSNRIPTAPPLAVLLLTASLATLLTSPLAAQPRPAEARDGTRALPSDVMAAKAPYRLVIDHISGDILLEGTRGGEIERWQRWQAGAESAPLAEIPPDRPVQVVIRNANSLLYNYSVDAAVVAQRNVRTCRELGSGFTQRGFLIGLGAMRGITPPPPSDANLFRQTEDLFGTGTAQLTRSGGAAGLGEAAAERGLASVRPALERHIAFLATLQQTSRMLEDSIAASAELAESVPLDTLLRRLQDRVERLQPGLSDPARVRAIVMAEQGQAAAATDALAEIVTAVRSGTFGGSATGPVATEALQLEARLLSARRQAVDAYRPLQNALLKLQRMRAETTQSFMVHASRDIRRITVQVQPSSDFSDVPRIRQGAVDIFTAPRTAARCDISIGFGWMDAPAQYAVRNGVLTETTPRDPRVTPAVLFHLASDRIPLIGVSAGVGVGQNARPDFYVGGTFRYLEPVLVNYGWVWQRSPILPDGAVVGAPLGADRLENLDMQYRRSVFIGLSMSVASPR
jgi:hypothetical protein